MKTNEFVKKVREIEGFDVDLNGWDAPEFDYKRAAPSKLTVSQWVRKRCGEDQCVSVFDGDGHEVHGRTQLSTVRRSYE